MKIYIQFVLLSILLSTFCACTNSKQTNLTNKTKLSIYLDNANNEKKSQAYRLFFSKKAKRIVSSLPKDSLYFSYAFKVANRFWNLQNFNLYKIEVKQIILNSQEKGDKKSLAKGYKYLSEYYCAISKFDSAYIFNHKSFKIYHDLKLNRELANSLLIEAVFHHNQSNFLITEKKIFQAIKYIPKENNDQLWFQAYNMLGTVYDNLNDFDTSLRYYLKAQDIVEKGKIPLSYDAEAILINNIGVLYRNWGNQSKALSYFKNALIECTTTTNSSNVYAMIIDNLAVTKLKLKSDVETINNLQTALKIREQLNNTPATISTLIHISEYFEYKKDIKKSIEFASRALDMAKKNNEKHQELEALEQLIQIDSKNVLLNFNKYLNLQDSLQIAERRMQNKFARIEYETEELEIENRNLLTYQQKLSIFGSVTMLLLIIGFISRHLMARKREYALLLDKEFANKEMSHLLDIQNEKIEHVRKHEKDRIAQELHDGVMGKLSGIRLNLFLLERYRDENTIKNCLSKIKEIQDVEREIRNIAYDLDNSILTGETTFDSLIKNLFASIQQYSSIRFIFYCDPILKLEMIGKAQKIQLYRIMQESFHNIEKYAQASVVSIGLKSYKGKLCCYICDNGKGFVVTETETGIGLKSMRRRIKEVNGLLEIESAINKGTKIKFYIPLN